MERERRERGIECTYIKKKNEGEVWEGKGEGRKGKAKRARTKGEKKEAG